MKNILKGLLLWSTAIAVFLFLGSIDSIDSFGNFLAALLIIVLLILLCQKCINYDEACKLSGANWLDKIFGK